VWSFLSLLKGMICMLAVEWRGRGYASAAGRKNKMAALKPRHSSLDYIAVKSNQFCWMHL